MDEYVCPHCGRDMIQDMGYRESFKSFRDALEKHYEMCAPFQETLKDPTNNSLPCEGDV